jgi:GTPase SAR1 family protein
MAAASSSSIDQLKILLVGDNATGKHCYIKMLTQNKFLNDTRSNVSISSSFLENSHHNKFQIS